MNPVRLDEVNRDQEPEWLFPERIPFGRLTMTFGEQGGCKGYLVCALAALGADSKHPTGFLVPPNRFDTLIMAGEESAEEYANRLAGMCANLAQIHVAHRWSTDDIELLERYLNERKRVRLVIIDPIESFLIRSKTTEQDIRDALSPLAALAMTRNIAIHYTLNSSKNEDRLSIHRTSGSMALVSAPRLAFVVGDDPADSAHKVWACVKANGANKPSSVGFRVDAGVFRWDSTPCTLTADDVLRPRAFD